MTYVRNKPDSGKAPDLDAPIIQGNFASYATIFATNHIALNNFNQGCHGQVIFENQANFPTETINSNHLLAHNATSKAGTQPQLFVKIPTFLPTPQDPTKAPNVPMQLTYNQVNIIGPQYQSFMIGGYLVYFGTINGMTTPNVKIAQTIILSPAPTSVLIAIATPNTMTTVAGTGNPSPFTVGTTIDTTLNDRFTINSDANLGGASIPYTIGYFAIGKV